MKTLYFIFISMLFTSVAIAQDVYKANVDKTILNWLGEKVVGEHHGTINIKSGSLTMNGDQIVNGEFIIDMTSIKCMDLTDPEWNGKLVGHLKSDDFFAVEKYPTAKLLIKSATKLKDGSFLVKSDLTIKNKTNPLEFKSAINKTAEGIWFYSNIVVDRTSYDVQYGSGSFFDNLGDKTIYDEFKVKVNLLVTK